MNNLIIGLVILSKYSDNNDCRNDGDWIYVKTFDEIEPSDIITLENCEWEYLRKEECWAYLNG